jgi:YHS domain-containing protein
MQQRMVTDPVCGLQVDPTQARFTSTYQGKTYYFTDPDCKRMFDEDPAAYVGTGSVSEGGRSMPPSGSQGSQRSR